MKKQAAHLLAALAIAGGAAAPHTTAADTPPPDHTMKIRLTLNGASIAATLADNPSARDFASLLPLRLTLRDYASTEKIADLPRRLGTAGSPTGSAGRIGDIAYYAPWGNLAIFYRDGDYAPGLVPLARIDAGANVLSSAEGAVVIERIRD